MAADLTGTYLTLDDGRPAVRFSRTYDHPVDRVWHFVTDTEDIPATHKRLEGYRRALAEAGIRFDQSLVEAGTCDTSGGYLAARRLLVHDDRPTALFCFNDRMAMGAYRAAAELDLSIPRDLSVVGFDNQELICEGLVPPLTTVELPHYAMGARATALLLSMNGAGPSCPVEPELLPCPLVRRDSVAPPSTAPKP